MPHSFPTRRSFVLLWLVVYNVADLRFALDVEPAIFAITTDMFIVYTSNVMAILGLRALYFALAAMVHRFHYLKYALAAILVFIGAKIFVADFVMEIGRASCRERVCQYVWI